MASIPVHFTVPNALGVDVNVTGRAAAMIAMLVVYRERINEGKSGHLTFHYNQSQLEVEVLDKLARVVLASIVVE